jgi:hypothetical protein
LAAQAPFDLRHEVFGQPRSIEGLLQGCGGVLCLVASPCKALLSAAATTLSGVGVAF